MQNYSKLEHGVRLQNEVLVEVLRLLTVLKQHEFGVAVLYKYEH